MLLRPTVETVVFSEFRLNGAGRLLIDTVRGAGFGTIGCAEDVRGVMIASRSKCSFTINPGGLAVFPSAMLRADFANLVLYGVYLPTGERKFAHFDFLIRAARRHNNRGDRAVAIGDFNAGQNEIDIQINARSGKLLDSFPAHSRFLALDALWPEAWRRLHPGVLEYSWYASTRPASRYRGWRLDHAFISPALLPRLRSAEYVQETRLRGFSDHAALVVEIA
jgi:exonuclease III